MAVLFVEFVQRVYCAPQATGINIAPLLEALITITSSLVLAFFYGWKLTLVILAFLPVMVLAGKVYVKAIGGSAKSEASSVLEAGKVRIGLRPCSHFCSALDLCFCPSERLSLPTCCLLYTSDAADES